MCPNAKVTYCSSKVNVSVSRDENHAASVGGFIGAGNGNTGTGITVNHCYAAGNVNNASFAGSFMGSDAGRSADYGRIENCYARGLVTNASDGQFAFSAQDLTQRSTISNCYYNSANPAKSEETSSGKSMDEMSLEAFAAALNAGDSSNGWIFLNGKVYCGAEPADYSAVDAAEISARGLNKEDYEDFSAVEAAMNAVVRGKIIAQQDEVDAMARAIEDAVSALVRKKPSGGKSSSGGGRTAVYPIQVTETANGTVTVSLTKASKDTEVTVIVKPDNGYRQGTLTGLDDDGNPLKFTNLGDGKYRFVMPASSVEIKVDFVKEAEVRPFEDVAENTYYYEAVKWAVEKGITGGVGRGLFEPNGLCTRAQIVAFLWRTAGSPEPKILNSFRMFRPMSTIPRLLHGQQKTVLRSVSAEDGLIRMPSVPGRKA